MVSGSQYCTVEKDQKKMRYRLFGRSGLRVSELCLGTMTFGEKWNWGASREESRRIFDAFIEAGGNFLDTANFYTCGQSETYLGEFTKDQRDRYVIATKFTLKTRDNDPNASGNHRKNLAQSLNDSLKRLQTDYIDIYWVHAWDYVTPVEELMRALDDAVRAGKILYAGISDAPAWRVSEANTLAQLRGWTPFTGLQIEYSLVQRTVERDLLPMAQAFELAVAAWSPLASGLLTGKFTGDGKADENARLAQGEALKNMPQKKIEIARAVQQIADESGKSPSQIALAWLRQRPGNIIPIIGARKLSQIQDNLGCLEVKLSADQAERLEKISEIEYGFPHDFLAKPTIRDYVHGGYWDQLDR
jgi:aryl-alcohol dehydrogenase-like predicted oxidoreductase